MGENRADLDSTTSAEASSQRNAPSMDLRERKEMDRVELEGNMYQCKHCKTPLAVPQNIVSRMFHCKHGKAYLFNEVVNVSFGEEEDRMMMTGGHTVRDISCISCGSMVGWRYEKAQEKSQQYKEGKFILERYMVIGPGESYILGNQDSQSDLDE